MRQWRLSMTTVGYRRVSTLDQSLDRQDLQGCDRIFEEKVSGGNKDRPQLQEMIRYIREGDKVLVWSIDRLARDLRDLQQIIQSIVDKGAAIQFQSEGLSFSGNSDDPFAKLQLQMMGAFAEFERNIIRKRQAEGIAKAKAAGKYKNAGRKATIDVTEVQRLRKEGHGATEIAETLGIGRASVYRLLEKVEA